MNLVELTVSSKSFRTIKCAKSGLQLPQQLSCFVNTHCIAKRVQFDGVALHGESSPLAVGSTSQESFLFHSGGNLQLVRAAATETSSDLSRDRNVVHGLSCADVQNSSLQRMLMVDFSAACNNCAAGWSSVVWLHAMGAASARCTVPSANNHYDVATTASSNNRLEVVVGSQPLKHHLQNFQ